ncbi:beta-ketoacyl synthase chain length factor [Succinimonas amylolytica]|uniref:beta-ketoacyl synthase chain length factor n=1 Tax=Succinimonas amylolytica TaxID=83769 RepID=UPI0023A88D26
MFCFQLDDICYAASRGTGLRGFGSPVPAEDCAVFQKDLSSDIPMLLRRRLLPAGRLAVGAGSRLLARWPDISRIIFASRTGESVRCFRMLQEIFAGNGLSPMEFASSVQNSNAGVLSIIRGYQGEVTAVAGGVNTLSAAVTEAWAALCAHPDMKRILLAVSEESLEGSRDILAEPADFGGEYALVLVLSRCSGNGKAGVVQDLLEAQWPEGRYLRRYNGGAFFGFSPERDGNLSGRELGAALADECGIWERP